MTAVGRITELTVYVEEIGLGLAELLLLLRFYRRVYGKAAVGCRRLFSEACAVTAVMAVLSQIFLQPGRPVAMPPVMVLCSFIFLRHYRAGRGKKILFSCVLFVVSFLWLEIADIIITPLQSRNYWGIIAFVHLIFWLLTECIGRAGGYEETAIPFSLWILLMGITVSSGTVLFIMFGFIIKRDDPYAVTIEIPVMLVLLLINVSLFIFFDRFSVLIRTAEDKAALEQKMQMQEQHYRELEQAHHRIRTIQHDMKNCLRIASRLASKQDGNAELAAFLERTTGEITGIEQMISTGNTWLDTVLNIKINEMQKENIRTDTMVRVPAGLEFSLEQAAVILGNLLDNAKEACLELPEERRRVVIKIEYINHALLIRIENTRNSSLFCQEKETKGFGRFKASGLPVSTKKNPDMHGLGLENVKKIVEKLGTFEFEENGSSFLVRIVLYNPALSRQTDFDSYPANFDN